MFEVVLNRIKMGTLQEPSALTARLQNTLMSYHSLDENEWRVAKKSKDVTVWRKSSEEFRGYLYKSQGMVDDNPNRIVDYIRPGPYRLDWDSLMTAMDIIETLDQGCCVMRYTTAGQLWNIIAPREFIDFSYTTDYQDGLLSCGISVEHEEQHQSYVRGFNHPCGWFCVPTPDSTTTPAQSLLTGWSC
ncbi:stAR-related lipid transfer protein 4 isoform X3 [Oncorhynchus kisutch]|uniref:stAR-related lipid transfer protein 4 isoform X3 n=1 Tax=Oncorhynchus kisutch TaxID=8019 RepID=UPI0012DE8274|nr:stAR-related lipid transfer protein 4 isoform X3 [Oncorhynchus kisutch]